MTKHQPVLVNEILEGLNLTSTDTVLDGTLGFGGHAKKILPFIQKGHYFGFDQDPVAIQFNKTQFNTTQNIHIFEDNFSNFDTHLKVPITKCLLDLGFSSFQLDEAKRGFSHQVDEPLDMRMNPSASLTAQTILNTYSHKDLSDMFYLLGDLKHNKKLCESIFKKRPLQTTPQLMACIKSAFSFQNNRRLFMKVSAQVFQALRIETNQEFEHLRIFLEKIPPHIKTNGILAILTFHPGEDSLVKHTLKAQKNIFKPINKHVITATQSEIRTNLRSKPAKLRLYRKI